MKSYRKQAQKHNDTANVELLTQQLNEVEEPEVIDPRAKWLKQIFIRLSLRRTSGMNGPEPIQPTEMKAWLELNDIRLVSWEVGLLEMLDNVLLASINNKNKEDKDGLQQPSIQS